MGYDRGDSFPSILNQMELHLVQNRKENCHHDLIPFNLKVIRNRIFSVYVEDNRQSEFPSLGRKKNVDRYLEWKESLVLLHILRRIHSWKYILVRILNRTLYIDQTTYIDNRLPKTTSLKKPLISTLINLFLQGKIIKD